MKWRCVVDRLKTKRPGQNRGRRCILTWTWQSPGESASVSPVKGRGEEPRGASGDRGGNITGNNADCQGGRAFEIPENVLYCLPVAGTTIVKVSLPHGDGISAYEVSEPPNTFPICDLSHCMSCRGNPPRGNPRRRLKHGPF